MAAARASLNEFSPAPSNMGKISRVTVLPLTTRNSLVVLALAVIATFSLGAAKVAWAGDAQPRYVFRLTKIELPAEAPAELESLIRKQVATAVANNPLLSATLPADAPDPKNTKRFKRYLRKHHLRVFKVNVEVQQYEEESEDNPDKPGHIIGTTIELRMFGEELPKRIWAFEGRGSARIKIEVGKKIRDADRRFANEDATRLAVGDAVSTGVEKLEKSARDKRKKRRRKKKRKK
jgi:hypothetical protein